MDEENDNEVTLREITEDTLSPILKLKVGPDQEQFVAENSVSIAQAHFSEYAWFRGIYAGEKPVGFVMLYLDPEEEEYDIWRFMIDRNEQRKGYGRAAMLLVLDHLRTMPDVEEVYLSYVPAAGNPSPFYAKFGFADTGEWEEDEKLMSLEL